MDVAFSVRRNFFWKIVLHCPQIIFFIAFFQLGHQTKKLVIYTALSSAPHLIYVSSGRAQWPANSSFWYLQGLVSWQFPPLHVATGWPALLCCVTLLPKSPWDLATLHHHHPCFSPLTHTFFKAETEQGHYFSAVLPHIKSLSYFWGLRHSRVVI